MRFIVPRQAVLLALLIGVPAAGLFCLQWAGTLALTGSSLIPADQPTLVPRTDFSSEMTRQARYGSADMQPIFRVFSSGSQIDPIFADSNPRMIGFRGDPFFEALSSGISEGPLLVQGRSRNIPTLGPPLWARRTTMLSDRAILREIQIGVGSSFSNFIDNVFDTADKKGETQTQTVNAREENPFAKPQGADSANQASASTGNTSAKPQLEAKPPNEPAAPAETKPPETTPPATGTLATTLRPDIMLHVDENGLLHTMGAARLNERTYETAELGIRHFNTLTFSNPAEIPAAVAVADFNLDGVPDVCFLDSRAGILRFFHGGSDGDYSEAMRIEVGGGPRSLATGDFDGDGRPDVAISNVGTGTLTYLFLGATEDAHSFKSLWVDQYRDYIAAWNTTGAGAATLLGMNFAGVAEPLDSARGIGAGSRFNFAPALDCKIAIFNGRQLQVNAVLLGSNLSLNLQNLEERLTNVLNLHSTPDVYVIVGDLLYNNSLSLAVATLKNK